MSPYRPGIDPDRRKGPDVRLKALRWFGAVGWLIMLAALIILGNAKPQTETFFDRSFNIQLRNAWDMNLARDILYLMMGGLVISVASLILNASRHRRKNDQYRISFIFMGFLSVVGILAYFFLF
ncbi:MAG: hypothetical protein P8184_04375 [Calditrichia bacterium]